MSQDSGSPHELNENSEVTGRRNNDHLFQNMAKQNVPYPVSENITAVEIATFFTNWLREYDPVFRLVSNGASNSLLTEIINHHRVPSDKGEVMNNSLCKLVQTAVRSTGHHKYGVPHKEDEDGWMEVNFELWSIYHHTQANTKDEWGPWNNKSLAVGDVRRINEPRNGPLESVDFKVLCNGVKCFPSLENGDGLDLTRCVLYAQANPQTTFMFPDDFGTICNLIGRTPVEQKHLDGETFKRWAVKYQENKKAARAARLANPSPAVAKITRNKISKSRFVDPNNKVNKLKAKIEEAVENGRLALGDNGQLILLDKPKAKVEPVSPAAGQRTHSSALCSPVKSDAQAYAHNFGPRTPGSGASTVIYHSPSGAANQHPQTSGQSYSYPAAVFGDHSQVGTHNAQPDFVTNNVAPQTFANPDMQKALESGFFEPRPAPHVEPGTHASNELQASGTDAMPFRDFEFDISHMMSGDVMAFDGPPMTMGQTPHPTEAPSSMQHHVQNDLANEVGFFSELGGMPGMDFESFRHQQQEGSGAPQGFTGANYRGELRQTLPFDPSPSSPPPWG